MYLYAFIRRSGVSNCLITCSRRYSRDLPQGKKFALMVHEMCAIICSQAMPVLHGCVFYRTHISNALSSTNDSEICFPRYFVSPPPLRKFSYNATG